MTKNVGKIDQIIRFVLAAGFLVVAIVLNWWFVLGTVLFAFTAAFGFCGVYALLGVDTCKIRNRKEAALEKTEE